MGKSVSDTNTETEEGKQEKEKLYAGILIVLFVVYKIFFSTDDNQTGMVFKYETFFPASMMQIDNEADYQQFVEGYRESECPLRQRAQAENFEFTNVYVTENGYFAGINFTLEGPVSSKSSQLESAFIHCTESFENYIKLFNEKQLVTNSENRS